MILSNLILKDFGGHKSLDFTSNASTVGILGPNGAGKSTILSAINFLLTGETADPQETYVRAGCDNGSGTLTFTKNGMVGKIFRQIGKTPKRKLEWDNRVITKAAEVDDTLAALFGADKKAVSSAVFIAQGDLQNILFGSQVERETLFIRLVNLAFCDQRAKMIEGKVKKIALTVQDLGAVIDQARLEVQRSQISLEEANAQLALLADCRTEIARLEERISLTQQITEVGHRALEVNARNLTAQESLRSFLTAHSLTDAGTLAVKCSAMGLSLDSVYRRVDSTRAIVEGTRLLLMKDAEVTLAEGVLADATTRVANSAVPADDKANRAILDSQIQGRLTHNRLCTLLEPAAEKLQQAKLAVAALVDPGLDAKIAALAESISTQRSMLEQSRRLVAMQKELTACLGKIDPANSKCRECGLKIDPNQDIDPAKLAEYEAVLVKGQADLDASNAQLREFSQAQAAYQGRRETANRDLSRYQVELDQLVKQSAEVTQFATVDVQATQAQILAIDTRAREYMWATQERSNAALSLETRQKDRSGYLEMRQYVLDPSYTNDKLIELIGQRDALTAEHNRLKGLQAEAAALAATVEEIEKQLQQVAENEATITAKLAAIPTTQALDEILQTFGGQPDLAKRELVNRQSARDTQLGVVRQAEQVQKDATAKLKELQGRIAQDQKKLDCIARLQEMKALLSRSGLPGKYVAHRFDQLVQLTQQHLYKLNANFSVSADRETPLSFRFCRTDNGVDLSMTKMSGGQRVRLCLAFLMAVQTALVPDVGLLVLDEPSMHLDTEGKESLAELLRDAGQRLGGGGNQIWLVDHAMELEPALGSVLKL